MRGVDPKALVRNILEFWGTLSLRNTAKATTSVTTKNSWAVISSRVGRS